MLNMAYSILIGNGILRGFTNNSFSWLDLIKDLKSNNSDKEEYNDVPMNLQPILYCDDISSKIKENKDKLFGFGLDVCIELRDYIQKILSLNFKDILTTNYGYEIEKTAFGSISENKLKSVQRSLVNKKAESKYMLHTYIELPDDRRLWHIHGEARKPDSLVLSNRYYVNLVSRCVEEVKRFDKKLSSLKLNENQSIAESLYSRSWVDVIRFSDLYILGFGLDFSEIDIWYLLELWHEQKFHHGRIVFFNPETSSNKGKIRLLNKLGVKVENLGFVEDDYNKIDYKEFYRKAYEYIKNEIS
jgi:hypothetical protein